MIKEIYNRIENPVEFLSTLPKIKRNVKSIGWTENGNLIYNIYSCSDSRMVYITVSNYDIDYIVSIVACELTFLEWACFTSTKAYKKGTHKMMVSDKAIVKLNAMCKEK